MSQSYTESGVTSESYAEPERRVSYSGLPPGETVYTGSSKATSAELPSARRIRSPVSPSRR